MGLNPDTALYHTYRNALYRKTALLNGEVAAMWGVCGTPLSISGVPYLLTSPLVETVSPIVFSRLYIKEVQEMKKLFPVLENYVDAEYTCAVKMLLLAGFKLEGPITLNNSLFYKFSIGMV